MRNKDRINLPRLHTLFDTFCVLPGLHPAALARALGWRPDTIYNALPTLESAGLLLSEDARGGLYPFAVTDPQPITNEPCTMTKREM